MKSSSHNLTVKSQHYVTHWALVKSGFKLIGALANTSASAAALPCLGCLGHAMHLSDSGSTDDGVYGSQGKNKNKLMKSFLSVRSWFEGMQIFWVKPLGMSFIRPCHSMNADGKLWGTFVCLFVTTCMFGRCRGTVNWQGPYHKPGHLTHFLSISPVLSEWQQTCPKILS